MVKDENLKIKESISVDDKNIATQTIADAYFDIDEYGNISYTPYIADMAYVSCFALFFLDGLSFEVEADESGQNHISEDIYDVVSRDEDLMNMYREFSNYTYEDGEKPWAESALQFKKIAYDAKDMAEFKKQEILATKRNEPTSRIMELCDVVISTLGVLSDLQIDKISASEMKSVMSVIQKLAESGEITHDKLVDTIREAADFNFDDATKEILDSKNEEIRELKKYKLLWDSRNISK